jgi:hypothetical protein
LEFVQEQPRDQETTEHKENQNSKTAWRRQTRVIKHNTQHGNGTQTI